MHPSSSLFLLSQRFLGRLSGTSSHPPSLLTCFIYSIYSFEKGLGPGVSRFPQRREATRQIEGVARAPLLAEAPSLPSCPCSLLHCVIPLHIRSKRSLSLHLLPSFLTLLARSFMRQRCSSIWFLSHGLLLIACSKRKNCAKDSPFLHSFPNVW